MNAEAGSRERAPLEISTLEAALDTCFSPELAADRFPDRFVHLAAALTTSPRVFMFGPEGLLAAAPRVAPEAEAEALAAELLAAPAGGPEIRVARPWLGARIARPGGGPAVAVVALPRGTGPAQALAHERLTLLAALSARQYAHPDLVDLQELMRAAPGVRTGEPERLRAFADLLNRLSAADYAAIGLHDGQGIGALEISGQSAQARRGALPDRLRREMHRTARDGLRTSQRAFVPWRDGEGGVVVHVEAPARNAGILPLAAAALSLAAPPSRRRGPSRRTLLRVAGLAAILAGVAFVPVPDAVQVPAMVQAAERRVLTAPFAGTLRDVAVSDGARVAAGAGPLLRLDTEELDLELIGARSDYSAALLERESARAGRDAAALRNAELEAERLRSRIDLLELRKASAAVSAPIGGIVAAPDLAEREGTTVNQGEPLLEIADPARLELELTIPERVIGRMEDGAAGTFRPDYDPTLRVAGTVTRISPAQSAAEAAPMFMGAASLAATEGLRPGMRGVLSLERPARPVWSVVWEAARNWMLLRLWF